MLDTIRGQHLHILGRLPLDLLINRKISFVYLGRGFCLCGLSGVIVDLQYLLFIFSFYSFILYFLFLPNLGKSETFSISDCDSLSVPLETRSTTDLNL